MEHSVEFTTKDGTSYRLTYDNETNHATMHYLLHENGVLKVECSHHALPAEVTEDMFRSAIVPISFLNCVGRTLAEMEVKAQATAVGGLEAEMAKLINPHMALEQRDLDYLLTIAERGHSVELFVQLQQEYQVEEFARQLESANTTSDEVTAFEPRLITPETRTVSPISVPAWLPPVAFSVAVVLVVVAYMLAV